MNQSLIEMTGARFISAHNLASELYIHYVSPVTHMKALMDAVEGHDPEKYNAYFGRHEHYVMTLGLHGFPLGQVLLSHVVDNFNYFMIELLQLLFKERPETLKAESADLKLSVKEALEANSVCELIAKKKIAQIDGRGLRAMIEFLEKLGVTDILTESERQGIFRVIADRNVFAHQGGVIDDEYLRASGRSDVRIGESVRLSRADVGAALATIKTTGIRIANAMARKFALDENPWTNRPPRPLRG